MKVLILGDSPLLSTGFGRVNSIAARKFQEEGWEVGAVAGLTKEQPNDTKGIKFYVPTLPHDVLGVNDIADAVKDFQPDLAYMTADPGSMVAISYGTPDMPALAYTPIEGEPIINHDWGKMLSTIPLMTVSKYGSDLIKRQFNRDVPWVYHGVNHDVFRVVPGLRDEVRKNLRWEDKFVITCVSTNVRRKQLPRLIEAVAKLKHIYHQKDIVLYLHTVPFQNYWLEGWNLMEVVRMYGIDDDVYFHPHMGKFNASVPEESGNPAAPGLVEMYHASDLFVLPSQVEGFGLPIAESMACGVPVLVTQYAAGWEVASPAGRGIPVSDWEVHKSGTVYANVNVDLLAKEILRLKRNPKERARMSEQGLERVKDFQWSKFTDMLIPQAEQAIDAFETSSSQTEEEDKGDIAEPRAQDGAGAFQVALSPEEGIDIIEGQG
jgi:glycosyltransferase involved in cell wall biosynthesis